MLNCCFRSVDSLESVYAAEDKNDIVTIFTILLLLNICDFILCDVIHEVLSKHACVCSQRFNFCFGMTA